MNTEKNLFLQHCGTSCLLGWHAGNPNSEIIFNALCNLGVSEKSEPCSSGIFCYITATKSRIIQFLADYNTLHNRRRKKKVPKNRVKEIAAERFEKIPRLNFAAYNSSDNVLDGLRNLEGDFAGIDSTNPWEEYTERCVLG